MLTNMVIWLLNIVRKFLGHALLAPEEVQAEIHDRAKKREQERIMTADISTEQTADDLEKGDF